MSLCGSQAVGVEDFMMHHQAHKQQCGGDREGEKEMGGVEEAGESDMYKELLREWMMNGWKNTEKEKSEKTYS